MGDPRFSSRHRVGLRDRDRAVAAVEALRIEPLVSRPADADRDRRHRGRFAAGRAAGRDRARPGDCAGARPAHLAALDPGQRHRAARRGEPLALRLHADRRLVAGQSRSPAARGHGDAWRERREGHRVRAAIRHEARTRAVRIRLHAGHAVRHHARRPPAVGRVAAGRAACVRTRRRRADRADGRGRVRHRDGARRRRARRRRDSRRRVRAGRAAACGAARLRDGRGGDAAVLRADRVLRRGALAVRAGRDGMGDRRAGARHRRRVRRRAFRAAGADRQLDAAAVPAGAVRDPRRRRDVRADRTVRRPRADDRADDAVVRVGRMTTDASAGAPATCL
ncbi:hypothetical protein BVI1335_1580011 [Burkholderia vietnamiensis]|nr:hypothetical protein BVI1335_1580011 [Burkholderia vietnamiensis]